MHGMNGKHGYCGCHCDGCNCAPELKLEQLEEREKMLEEKLKRVRERKEELNKADK